jgi:type I restriction enzyme, R subunit
VPDALLTRYKDDLRRFVRLKAAVRLRFAESVDFSRDYEPRIQKLLNTHIFANEVLTLHEPVNIFDREAFAKVLDEQGHKSKAAQADTMAHAIKRTITERLTQNPAFYERFSKLIQRAIDDYHAKRIHELEYLRRVNDIRDSIVSHGHNDIPQSIRGNDDAVAAFDTLRPYVVYEGITQQQSEAKAAQLASGVLGTFQRYRKVDYWNDLQAQKQTEQALDDYLYDQLHQHTGTSPDSETLTQLIAELMRLARNRRVNA